MNVIMAGLMVAAVAVSDAERNNSTEMNAKVGASAQAGEKGGVRVLFLGNSITLHDKAPQIGWTNAWGMAASSEENDYVHIVTRGIERETGRKTDIRVRNMADWERGYETWQVTSDIEELIAFDAEYLVLAIAENTRQLNTEEERAAYTAALKRFFSLFLKGRTKPHTVVRGVFWPSEWKDRCLQDAASDLGLVFVKADFGNTVGMDAWGRYWHTGVARHPGDAGMVAIAGAILDGFFPKDSGHAARKE